MTSKFRLVPVQPSYEGAYGELNLAFNDDGARAARGVIGDQMWFGFTGAGGYSGLFSSATIGTGAAVLIVGAAGDPNTYLGSKSGASIVIYPTMSGGKYLEVTPGALLPEPVDTWDLGSASKKFKDIHLSGVLNIDGSQVVGTQGAAVADASGGATVDTEARTALNALLARLRAHGLIAT